MVNKDYYKCDKNPILVESFMICRRLKHPQTNVNDNVNLCSALSQSASNALSAPKVRMITIF